MARARNIKPGFFINEELADLSFQDRLVFIGLWTLADFKGCLEFKPRRIKASIMPYDECDIEQAGLNLAQARFIRIYSVLGQRYIKINNFVKHQRPHKNEIEAGSEVPDDDQADVVTDTNIGTYEKSPNNSELSPIKSVSVVPLTDSLLPLTDSPNANGKGLGLTASESDPEYLSGRPRSVRGFAATPAAEQLDEWLEAIAKAVGAKSPQTMASAKGWNEACMAAISEGKQLDRMLEVIETERERNRDTPQFFTPNSCLKILQSDENKPKVKKYYH